MPRRSSVSPSGRVVCLRKHVGDQPGTLAWPPELLAVPRHRLGYRRLARFGKTHGRANDQNRDRSRSRPIHRHPRPAKRQNPPPSFFLPPLRMYDRRKQGQPKLPSRVLCTTCAARLSACASTSTRSLSRWTAKIGTFARKRSAEDPSQEAREQPQSVSSRRLRRMRLDLAALKFRVTSRSSRIGS